MSGGFFVNKISAASAILAACTIGLAMAARTIGATHPSVQSVAALFGSTDSNKSHEATPPQIEAGSLANAVEAAGKAVFSLRVKYRAAAGGMNDGEPLDRFAPRVRTSQGSGFFISAGKDALCGAAVTARRIWNLSCSPTSRPETAAPS